jgi:hypothetical protein
VWESGRRFGTPEREICAVSRDGLVRMNSMSGRLQDLADIERLQGGEDD